MSFDCIPCNRSFRGYVFLQQHIRDSPAHAAFNCAICDRRYRSKTALEQHLRDSPVHTRSFDCDNCNRNFTTEEALQQHLRDSPIQTPSFDCETCDRSFSSEEALEQHLQDSPVHAPSFDCAECNRPFTSQEALQQHLRDARIHQKEPETPLDIFFRSFSTFDYDPSLPPATSYAKLRRYKGWRRDDYASKDAWRRYQDALESELRKWYGSESDLTAWHALCRAIGVEPLPQTCEQCEEAVRRTHVNIIDLIEWGRRRSDSEEKVRTFRTEEQLRDYTKKTGKIFNNTLDRDDGNVVLRHLLRRIFRIG